MTTEYAADLRPVRRRRAAGAWKACVTCSALSACCWEMRFADTPEAALRAMEHHPADVVVSDLRMPGLKGATLLALIEAWHPGPSGSCSPVTWAPTATSGRTRSSTSRVTPARWCERSRRPARHDARRRARRRRGAAAGGGLRPGLPPRRESTRARRGQRGALPHARRAHPGRRLPARAGRHLADGVRERADRGDHRRRARLRPARHRPRRARRAGRRLRRRRVHARVRDRASRRQHAMGPRHGAGDPRRRRHDPVGRRHDLRHHGRQAPGDRPPRRPAARGRRPARGRDRARDQHADAVRGRRHPLPRRVVRRPRPPRRRVPRALHRGGRGAARRGRPWPPGSRPPSTRPTSSTCASASRPRSTARSRASAASPRSSRR